MQLILYQFEDCPYCAKVRAKLDEKTLRYQKINVPRDRESPIRKEIAEKSGVLTVPVLKVVKDNEEKWIGESSEIIAYIDEKF